MRAILPASPDDRRLRYQHRLGLDVAFATPAALAHRMPCPRPPGCAGFCVVAGAQRRSDLCSRKVFAHKNQPLGRAQPFRPLPPANRRHCEQRRGQGFGKTGRRSRRCCHALVKQTKPNRPPHLAPAPPGGSRGSPRRIFSKMLLVMTAIAGGGLKSRVARAVFL